MCVDNQRRLDRPCIDFVQFGNYYHFSLYSYYKSENHNDSKVSFCYFILLDWLDLNLIPITVKYYVPFYYLLVGLLLGKVFRFFLKIFMNF